MQDMNTEIRRKIAYTTENSILEIIHRTICNKVSLSIHTEYFFFSDMTLSHFLQ